MRGVAGVGPSGAAQAFGAGAGTALCQALDELALDPCERSDVLYCFASCGGDADCCGGDASRLCDPLSIHESRIGDSRVGESRIGETLRLAFSSASTKSLSAAINSMSSSIDGTAPGRSTRDMFNYKKRFVFCVRGGEHVVTKHILLI